MRMWSRGLGRQNLGIDLSEVNVMTLEEATDYMVNEAVEPLLKELDGRKIVALSGKMLPPTGWEFVITMDLKDFFAITWKLLSWKTIKSFFFNSVAGSRLRNSDTLVGSATKQI
jgi:hypothetical protein